MFAHEDIEDPAMDTDFTDTTDASGKEYSLQAYKKLKQRPKKILSFEINDNNELIVHLLTKTPSSLRTPLGSPRSLTHLILLLKKSTACRILDYLALHGRLPFCFLHILRAFVYSTATLMAQGTSSSNNIAAATMSDINNLNTINRSSRNSILSTIGVLFITSGFIRG